MAKEPKSRRRAELGRKATLHVTYRVVKFGNHRVHKNQNKRSPPNTPSQGNSRYRWQQLYIVVPITLIDKGVMPHGYVREGEGQCKQSSPQILAILIILDSAASGAWDLARING